MALPEKDDLQRRLENLEAEINQMPPRVSVYPPAASEEKQTSLASLKEWFSNLHPAARIVLFAMAIILVISVLNVVFQLVASLLSIAILGLILYGVYKFLFAPSPPS